MNIYGIINNYKIKEEFKPILNSFFEMKQAVYGLTDSEIEDKIKETMYNINDIKYTNNEKIDVIYDYVKNEIVIGKYISNQIKKNGMNYSIIQSIFHGLSYAYDYMELSNSKRKRYLVDGKKIKLKSIIRQGINPCENGTLKSNKYALLDQCLNEAKTEILLQIGNNSSKLIFNEYQELQSVFEILCVSNNMDYIEFLKSIESRNIDEISTMMSFKNGNPKDETDKYLEELADCCEKMYTNLRKCALHNISNDEEKRIYMDNLFGIYETVYNISKIYVYNSNIQDKDLIYDKLNIIQSRVCQMFFDVNDPRIEKYKVNNSGIIMDNAAPNYSGNHIAISGIIIHSNNSNFSYKNRTMNIIQKIKNRFSKNIVFLNKSNDIQNNDIVYKT